MGGVGDIVVSSIFGNAVLLDYMLSVNHYMINDSFLGEF